MESLSPQAREILSAVIQEYILSGEPVASGIVARKSRVECSSATVRKFMAELEERGMLHQPHTSAGRLPTQEGLRFYVDRLMKTRQLSESERLEIRSKYQFSHNELEQLLRNISKLLSDLSQQCALVEVPSIDGAQLTRLEFVPMGEERLLAVLVLTSGRVENRIINLERAVRGEELERIHAYLNAVCSGKRLAEVRAFVESELEKDEINYREVERQALVIGREALKTPDRDGLLIEGQARLLEHPAVIDGHELKTLMRAIDEKKMVLRLLHETATNARGVKLFVGSEAREEDLKRSAMVAAPYGSGDIVGTLGVVGPSNMNYPRVVPVVTFAADMVTEILSKS